MEDLLVQTCHTAAEKMGSVVLDIEDIAQSISGSPKMSKVLSRKAPTRMDRWKCEDMEPDEPSRKLFIEVLSPEPEHSRSSLVTTRCLTPVLSSNSAVNTDIEGRNKRVGSFTSIRPRKLVLFFASLSCLGTLVLIYFTLAINHRGGI